MQVTFNGIKYNLERLLAGGKECAVVPIKQELLEINDETVVSDQLGDSLVILREGKYVVLVKTKEPLKEMNKCHMLSKYVLKKAKADIVYESSQTFNQGQGVGYRSMGNADRNQQRNYNDRRPGGRV